MPNPALQAALDHLARGWSALPFRARDKRPAVAWIEFQQRRAGPDEAQDWFRQWPDANVGIVTGAISGVVVLDVDPAHGGEASLEQLEHEHGPLPHTLEARTGGGGRHLYFAHPGRPVANRVGLWPGIDLRGDGGCVVTPPSLHRSGRRYLWVAGHDPATCNPAPLPLWLRTRLGVPAERIGHPRAWWRELLARGVGEGRRNDSIARLTGHLLWHGVDPQVALELLLCWNRVRCRPPLSDDEVMGVVDSIARLHRSGAARDAP